MKKNNVLVIPQSNPSAILRLFLFPYAGGSINTYIPWCEHFSSDIELVLVQPPGRGIRMDEVPFNNMGDIVNEILTLLPYMSQKPAVFFGHSLGGLIAFETCHELYLKNHSLPLHLIISGSRAPHINNTKRQVHDLPEAEIIRELDRMNGTPKELFTNQELLSLFIPLLRADFKVAESYSSADKKLPIPLSVIGGKQDVEIEIKSLEAWKELTSKEFQIMTLQGDHFFVNTQRAQIIREVKRIVSNCLNA